MLFLKRASSSPGVPAFSIGAGPSLRHVASTQPLSSRPITLKSWAGGSVALYGAARMTQSRSSRAPRVAAEAVATGAQTDKAATAQHLDQFLKWFRGDFDNCTQVAEDRERELGWRAHEHIHCRVTPVENKGFTENGEAVVFANYYYNGNPDTIYRQRMYKIIPGDKDLEMRIYEMTFIHGLIVRKANADFSSVDLGSIEDPERYTYLKGAEVFWRYNSDNHSGDGLVCDGPHFTGYMREGGWISETPNGSLRIEDDLVLTSQDLWVAEKVFNADNVMIAGNRDDVHHKMRRVHPSDEIRWTVDSTLDFIGSG